MKEHWKDVPGYEGLYQISIDTKEGKCRSLNYHQTGKVKVLADNISKGYKNWNLCKNGKCTRYQAARWIAITFPELIGNEYFEGAEIDHKDANRLNNHPSNLHWVTRKDNINNPYTRQHKSESMKGKNLKKPPVLFFGKIEKGKLVTPFGVK